jgi:hypothetical protein
VRARQLAAAVITASVLLSGCSGPDGDANPNPAPTSAPKNPLLDDQGIRPVRMTTGRALSLVPPETASQILCQILSKATWENLLGGNVGRMPSDSPSAGCVVSSEGTSVNVELTKSREVFRADGGSVGGRPSSHDPLYGKRIAVALTDDALTLHGYRDARDLLTMEVNYPKDLDEDGKRDLETRVLSELVPPLAKAGEPVPDVDVYGNLRYVSTPLAPNAEIVDLPTPLQALQLCTVLREGLDIKQKPPVSDEITNSGCMIRQEDDSEVVAWMTHTVATDKFPDRIAGRPARRFKDEISKDDRVYVLLRDGVDVALMVNAPDPDSIVARLVPILLA